MLEAWTYVLIMIIGGYSDQSGFSTIQQEFTTREKCEVARTEIASKVVSLTTPIKFQGCFQK